MYEVFDFIDALISLLLSLIPLVIIAIVLLAKALYVVRQQSVAIVERLGKFSHIEWPGFHVCIPFIDRIIKVSLMTEDEHMTFDAKTLDNVTIELDVSIQYHVDTTLTQDLTQSGIYRSQYMLTDPVSQMKDYFADALRSQIPNRNLEEVFSQKDAIAEEIDNAVASKMLEYGYVIVTTLITSIRLPKEVQESMNRIIASKNNLESATNDANAEKAKTVIAAQARAEAMEKEGEGIANQRIAIARGIKESIDTIRGAEMSESDADRLFEYTQWIDMMRTFAESKNSNTVLLPADFGKTASLFEQMIAADEVKKDKK